MKRNNRASMSACVTTLVFLTLFVASNAMAKDKDAKPVGVPATVVAHVTLPSDPGSQMLLQRKGSKQYLYIQQASKQGFMIVDVSKANQPIILKGTVPAAQAPSGDLEM